MLRAARMVVPGVAYHITQRGNRREDVFFCDDNRNRYPKLLLDASQARQTKKTTRREIEIWEASPVALSAAHSGLNEGDDRLPGPHGPG